MFTRICTIATIKTPAAHAQCANSRASIHGRSENAGLRLLSASLLVFLFAGCAVLEPFSADALHVPNKALPPQATQIYALPAPIAQAIGAAALPLDSVAILVQPLQAKRADTAPTHTLSHQAGVAMQPGSTMKLMTAAAAVELLGPIHRSAVEWRAAAPVGDSLAGPHHIRGLGHTELNAEATSRWLKTLRDAGVQRITGEVLLDRSLYSPSRVDLSTPPFDESPEFRYNVVPDALGFNTNLMGLRLAANTSTFSVVMDPPLPSVLLEPNFRLIDGKCADWENGWVLPRVRLEGGQSFVALSGTFPRNCKASTEINVLDRSAFATAWLQLHWQQLGGIWDATVRELADGQAAPVLPLQARSASRPLAETLRTINKSSDNPVTRMTYLALAEHSSTPARVGVSTAQRAEQALRSWMEKNKIDGIGLVMDNGSGLSRSERISANTLAQTLQVMAGSKWAPEFMSSLPIVGVDGTMRHRGKGSPAAERARMKTGTLRNAFALAGYVQNAQGEWQVVVAMINDERVGGPKARAVLDAVLLWAAGGS